MPSVTITREKFLEDLQGRTFSDVARTLSNLLMQFLSSLMMKTGNVGWRNLRFTTTDHLWLASSGSWSHIPAIDRSLAETHTQRSKRLRQAVGVVVRIIMQSRGWQKAGRKGSLGVRAGKFRRNPTTTRAGWPSGSFGPSAMCVPKVCHSNPYESVTKNLSPRCHNHRIAKVECEFSKERQR